MYECKNAACGLAGIEGVASLTRNYAKDNAQPDGLAAECQC